MTFSENDFLQYSQSTFSSLFWSKSPKVINKRLHWLNHQKTNLPISFYQDDILTIFPTHEEQVLTKIIIYHLKNSRGELKTNLIFY